MLDDDVIYVIDSMAATGSACLGLQPSVLGHNEGRKLSGSVTESISIIVRDMSEEGTEDISDNETGNQHNKNRRISYFNIDQEGKRYIQIY